MTAELPELRWQLPEKLAFLATQQARYKVAYGGRGSGKSWSYARALLVLGSLKPLRVLCAREVQKSIKQSVHTLLNDQIQSLGLGKAYEVTEAEIRGRNGTLFSFAGLATHTVESIKSFEGVDVCWVEEAQTVSKRSWDILVPTIRKPDSEIWISFNPDLDTDETYTRFVEHAPDNAIVRKVNYSDNPWFPQVLEIERVNTKTRDHANYENIWEGKCRAAAQGAIYAGEVTEAQEQKRVCRVDYDPDMKVHAVFDLGWNDSMSIILCQRHLSEIRVIEYIEDDHKTLAHYSALLKKKELNWGKVFLPHDGATKDYKYDQSAQDIMQRLGWRVQIVPRLGIEEGIKVARQTFNRVYFDRDKAAGLLRCLKNYKRRINTQTNEPGEPLHDEHSHGADAFRYLCVSAPQMWNETDDTTLLEPEVYPDS